MTQRAPVNPSHYRLSPETWAEIVEAYRDGATARELAVKWKVAPGSVYYHACKDGWSKKKNGDDRARAHAKAVEADQERHVEAAPDNRAARLFDGVDLDEAESDPGVLGKAAVLASGRAMTGRLWAEAKALVGLAESYGRLAKTAGGAAVTLETIDLPLLYEILFERQSDAHARFALWDDGPETEHYALRRKYWDRIEAGAKAMQWQADNEMARHRHRRALEQLVRDLGGDPPEGPEV